MFQNFQQKCAPIPTLSPGRAAALKENLQVRHIVHVFINKKFWDPSIQKQIFCDEYPTVSISSLNPSLLQNNFLQ